jgi:hypothetical protein
VKKADKISSIFPKHLFWDIDMKQLDALKDKEIIIPRALFMSDSKSFDSDMEKLENLYSSLDIVRVLKSTKERISNNVCKLVANRYQIPKFSRFSYK